MSQLVAISGVLVGAHPQEDGDERCDDNTAEGHLAHESPASIGLSSDSRSRLVRGRDSFRLIFRRIQVYSSAKHSTISTSSLRAA